MSFRVARSRSLLQSLAMLGISLVLLILVGPLFRTVKYLSDWLDDGRPLSAAERSAILSSDFRPAGFSGGQHVLSEATVQALTSTPASVSFLPPVRCDVQLPRLEPLMDAVRIVRAPSLMGSLVPGENTIAFCLGRRIYLQQAGTPSVVCVRHEFVHACQMARCAGDFVCFVALYIAEQAFLCVRHRIAARTSLVEAWRMAYEQLSAEIQAYDLEHAATTVEARMRRLRHQSTVEVLSRRCRTSEHTS